MRTFFGCIPCRAALTFAACLERGAADAGSDGPPDLRGRPSGHLDQAQQMMDQVLRDHPNSAKAHYVQAELYAREGKAALARSELSQAEQLKPGLPDENPRSVQALKSATRSRRSHVAGPVWRTPRRGRAAFPLGHGGDSCAGGRRVLDDLSAATYLRAVSRRRRYAGLRARAPTARAASGPGWSGRWRPGRRGGMGSSIAGGLAGGLAAGAGIVAGEELAHHFPRRRPAPRHGAAPSCR